MSISESVAVKLRQMCESNSVARHTFKALAERQRDRKDLDLYRMYLELTRGGIGVNQLDMLKLGEDWQRLGLGKLHVRRLPDHSVFESKFSMRDIAKTALAPGASVTQSKGFLAPTPTPLLSKSRGEALRASNEVLTVFIPLRDDTLPLQLPSDFSEEDARRIGDYLVRVAQLKK